MIHGRFPVLSSNCDIYCIPNRSNIFFISLNIIFVDEEIYYLGGRKLGKLIFDEYHLNYLAE